MEAKDGPSEMHGSLDSHSSNRSDSFSSGESTNGTAPTLLVSDGSDSSKGDPKSLKDFKDELKHSLKKFGMSSRQAFRETVQTLREADGISRRYDVVATSKSEALALLKDMVAEERKSKKRRCRLRWNFANVPLETLDCSLDDIYNAFIQWGKEECKKQDDESHVEDATFNVSKSFRRLEAYATWMDKTGTELIDPPLTVRSIEDAYRAWGIKASHDKEGRLVWWVDLTKVQHDTVKHEIPPIDSMRAIVWISHVLMLDPQGQENGTVLVHDVGKCKFLALSTLIPPKLAIKLDKLTVGTLPIRMHHVYICNASPWFELLHNIFKPFMSVKMRQRIKMLDDPSQTLVAELGSSCIPHDFFGGCGKMEKDVVASKFPILAAPDDTTSTTAVDNDRN